VRDEDRKFYMMWGLAIVLIGIAAALGYMGYGAEGALLLFGGIGVALILVSGDDDVKFYGGVGFLLLGILIYAIMSGVNVVLTIIAIVIVIGGLVLWHGLRGEKNEGSA